MRSSALKKCSGISPPFPAAPAEWEQEAASTLFLKACKQWARMWRLSESPCSCCSPWNGIPVQNKDQLTQGVEQSANDNHSWQDPNNPEITVSLSVYNTLIKRKSTKAVLVPCTEILCFTRIPFPAFQYWRLF